MYFRFTYKIKENHMYTFIANPNSRSGRGMQIWNSLEDTLKRRNVCYQIFFTKYRRHATDIVRELTSDQKEHTIVVVGGDGTLNEVINGIVCLSKVTLGYIPDGSGNDFSRGMRLPKDPQKALENILAAEHERLLDIGVLAYEDTRRRFIVSSGIGFDAAVCHEVMVSKLKTVLNKIGLGSLTYVGVALRQLATLKKNHMTLVLDDGRKQEFDKAYFAAAMNLPYEGGGFKFCPGADPQDGLLDVIVISDLSRLKILTLLPLAVKGWHTRFHGVDIYPCRRAELTSRTPHPVHTDGETEVGKTRVTFSVEPEKLRVIGM